MPSAGSLGLGSQLREEAPEIAPLIDGLLEALDEGAAARGADGFGALAPQDRVALVEEQAAVVPAILFHLYRTYYARPEVLGALGMPPRPPYPEGYELEPGDLGLLDPVRSREKLYRDA